MHTIVFDFGNVVGFFDHFKALNRLAAYTSLSPQEVYRRFYASSLEDDYESGRLTTDEFVAAALHLGEMSCDRDEFLAAFMDIFTPNPEVCSLIEPLKSGNRLLLGSNTNEAHAQQFRRQFANVLRHFDGLVLSFEVGARKPKPAFFAACQSLTDSSPDQCLFIDDLPANVAGAEALGWRGIVYRPEDGLAAKLRACGIAW